MVQKMRLLLCDQHYTAAGFFIRQGMYHRVPVRDGHLPAVDDD
uniref:Uncharacterized protein n=1 Tax=Triticum urartu TaxID=4572 RepID=A0A8R7UZP4_TRIUA